MTPPATRVAALLLVGGLVALPAAAQGPAATASQGVDLAAVDAWVDSAPAEAERSVGSLAGYLAEAGPGEVERVRAIYRWLTMNVAYDTRGYRTGDYGDLSPEGVLRRRSAVCTGYAGLAEALGSAMGLEIRVLNGWSKGYGYTAGQTFDGPANHAWNAVRVDGRWRLMDPTWGAGYLDGRMEFVRDFREHYFLTDPEAFVFDHLPEAPEWQLLDDPLEPAEYEELVSLRPAFFSNRLEVRSHDRIRIETDDRVTVTLGAPDDVQLVTALMEAESGSEVDGSRTFVQVAGGEARISAALPEAGDYVLRLFAKPKGRDGPYDWALDYRVRARRGDPAAGFPTVFGTFGATGTLLYGPLEGTLEAGRSYRFRLRAPGALGVAVVSGGQWTHLTAGEDGVFEGDVVAAVGDVGVFARYEEAASFQGLVKYTGR